MPLPARVQELFGPELEEGETLRSAANADLWLRYRRLGLTDRRLIAVERGGVRNPLGGRRVTSIPLTDVLRYEIRRNTVQAELALQTRNGARRAFAMPAFSKGTPRFLAAVERALGERPSPSPDPPLSR